MHRFVLILIASTLISTPVWAQSLKPQAPAPLQPGINKGTVDNLVGTHYWYFTALPGKTHVRVKFKSMGFLGNPAACTVIAELYDSGGTWKHVQKPLLSNGTAIDTTFDGEVKKPTKLIVSISPPPNGLVRNGGDYEIEATGAIDFAKESNIDPVIGMYKQMCGYTKLVGDCKFQPDGNIVTTSGANGHWKLFDKDSRTYVIDMDGEQRVSVQLSPGRGLCDSSSTVMFQQIK